MSDTPHAHRGCLGGLAKELETRARNRATVKAITDDFDTAHPPFTPMPPSGDPGDPPGITPHHSTHGPR